MSRMKPISLILSIFPSIRLEALVLQRIATPDSCNSFPCPLRPPSFVVRLSLEKKALTNTKAMLGTEKLIL
jgi:hypothetical protein